MKSYIVQCKETKKYFIVDFYLTHIASVSLTEDKNSATVFSDEGDDLIFPNGKVSLNKIKTTEFNLFLLQRNMINKCNAEEVNINQNKVLK